MAVFKKLIHPSFYKKLPPRSGYQAGWELFNTSFMARQSEYGSASQEDDRHLYLKMDDGTVGRISIRFKPVGNHRDNFQRGQIVIDYSINTDGSGYVRGIDEIGSFNRRGTGSRSGCVDASRRTEKKNNRIYP